MKNDNRILDLKNLIKEKKEKLASIQKFNPITNCSIFLNEKRYNIHTLCINDLKILAVFLNSLKMSAIDLKYGDIVISGYKISEWLNDINNKINNISLKEEKIKLDKLEYQLSMLLSEDKKTELQIDEIESLLN